ncbi:unnamed protein product [Coccothraustes coccothraustes]
MWRNMHGDVEGEEDDSRAERQTDARRRAEGYVVQGRRAPPGQSFRCGSSVSFQHSRFPVGSLKFTLASRAARPRGMLRRQGQAGIKAAIAAAAVTWRCRSIHPARSM